MRARSRSAALLLLAAWVLPGVACNLPIFPAESQAPSSQAAQAVRETLAAELFATPLPPPPEGDATPLPGLPIVPLPPPTAMPAPLDVPVGLPISTVEGDSFRYITQPGDTLAAIARRFDAPAETILEPGLVAPEALLPAGLMLTIPNTIGLQALDGPLMPDVEVVHGPTAADFSVEQYVQAAGGFLSSYTEDVDGSTLTGAQIIQRVVDDTSMNPRILLAVLEHRAGWVRGAPADGANRRYPIGFYANDYGGLHKEMTLAARQLTIGYYGWRSGKVLHLSFTGGPVQRMDPTINAGTAAVQYLFSTLYKPEDWRDQLYGAQRFLAVYEEMFGSPWARASQTGALLPDGLAQPALELPFLPGERWSFTGGPHAAWGVGSAWGGLDFAPVTSARGCDVSPGWATASAPALVLRSQRGQVLLDLDGDGREQTGWVLLYLHIAEKDRVPAGTRLNVDDRVGHPSCEGGFSTGAHVHIARKYNGEWIAASGPLPFVLSGWQAVEGARPYDGVLVKGDQVVTARPDGSRTSSIIRE